MFWSGFNPPHLCFGSATIYNTQIKSTNFQMYYTLYHLILKQYCILQNKTFIVFPAYIIKSWLRVNYCNFQNIYVLFVEWCIYSCDSKYLPRIKLKSSAGTQQSEAPNIWIFQTFISWQYAPLLYFARSHKYSWSSESDANCVPDSGLSEYGLL